MNCEKSCKKVMSITFIVVLACFFLLILGQFVIKNILIDALGIQWAEAYSVTGGSDGMVDIDFSKQYPFEQESIIREETDSVNVFGKVSNAWTSKIQSVVKVVKGYSDDYLPFKEYLKVPSGFFDCLIDNRMVGADDMWLETGDNGLIVRSPFPSKFSEEELDTTDLVKQVVDFKNTLSESGIDFLYVQTPVKEDQYDESYVSTYGLSYESQLANQLLEGLKEENIEVVDLREELYQDGISCYDSFFRTDNHWNIKTALWATGKLARYLNENHGYQFDVERFELSSYEEVVYRKWLQGTIGRSVTLAKTDYDDVSVYVPKFDTKLTMQIPTLNMNQTGDFLETMINPQAFVRRSTVYHGAYDAFAYSKPPVTRVINHLEQENNKKNILLLRESFAGPVISYLSLGIGELHAITPEGFNGSINSYISQVQPDMVIILYTAPTTNQVTKKYIFN